MINIADIIQGKFIEEFSAISMGEVLVAIVLSFALSLFIVFIYRVTYAGVSFSASFAGCIIMLSMVTTVVILVISSNVVLSLGMVGALSIVRFRIPVFCSGPSPQASSAVQATSLFPSWPHCCWVCCLWVYTPLDVSRKAAAICW